MRIMYSFNREYDNKCLQYRANNYIRSSANESGPVFFQDFKIAKK